MNGNQFVKQYPFKKPIIYGNQRYNYIVRRNKQYCTLVELGSVTMQPYFMATSDEH